MLRTVHDKEHESPLALQQRRQFLTGKGGYCISIVDREFWAYDIAFYHTWSRVTTNHTLPPFSLLPDPALLLPIRAWFPLSRSCFWKRPDSVTLDPGMDPLKPSTAATDVHHRARLRIFRPRFQRERVHRIIQRFCECMCINGSVNADHRTRFPVRVRTLIRPAIQPEHGDLLGLAGLPVGQKQKTIPGPRDWASLIILSSSRPGTELFLLSICFWGSLRVAPDLILRLCESTVPTCGCWRKRAREAQSGGSTAEGIRSVAIFGEPVKNAAKDGEGNLVWLTLFS